MSNMLNICPQLSLTIPFRDERVCYSPHCLGWSVFIQGWNSGRPVAIAYIIICFWLPWREAHLWYILQHWYSSSWHPVFCKKFEESIAWYHGFYIFFFSEAFFTLSWILMFFFGKKASNLWCHSLVYISPCAFIIRSF